MEILKGSHCQYQIRYHFVWGVKYAHELLFGERIKFLKKVIGEIGVKYDYQIEAVGTDENHLHLFAGAHPAIPPAKLAQTVKSISAREMFKEYPVIKRFLWGGSLWAIGYYVRTVSDGPLEKVVKEYIEHQGSDPKIKKLCQLKLVP